MMLDLKCKGLIDFRDVTNALDNFKNQDEDVKRIDLTSNDIRSVRHFLQFLIFFTFEGFISLSLSLFHNSYVNNIHTMCVTSVVIHLLVHILTVKILCNTYVTLESHT